MATEYVSYLRVSTLRQGRGVSIAAQREIIKSHLVDGKIIKEYIEYESGRKNNRPKMAKAIALCRHRDATIIVAKLDRLSRSVSFLSALIDSGIKVALCDFPTIPSGPMGKFMMHMLVAAGEFESGQISERTKAALKERKRLGILREDKPRIERKREAIRKAQKYRPLVEKMNKQKIGGSWMRAQWLNERNIPKPNGGKWCCRTVRKLHDRLGIRLVGTRGPRRKFPPREANTSPP